MSRQCRNQFIIVAIIEVLNSPLAVSRSLFLLLLAFLEHLLHNLLLFYQERSYNPILHAVCTS